MASGIYMIWRKGTENIYIGSAVDLASRWRNHTYGLRHQKHHSKFLQRCWNKYGQDNFVFSVIEYIEKENLIEREQYWLDLLKPDFNSVPIANSQLGFKHSDESRKKISLQKTGKKYPPRSEESKQRSRDAAIHKVYKDRDQWLKNLRMGLKGKKMPPHTEETKLKISIANKGKKYGPLSDERKKQISEFHKGRKKHSEESKKKMSERLTGRVGAMTGKTHSEETKIKMRMAAIGRKHSEETKKIISLAQVGRKHTDKARKNMSESQKRRHSK